MHFPKYWRVARQGDATAWGWSDEGPAQAEASAMARLPRILEWLRGSRRTPLPRYGYPDRPMREEVLREFRQPDGMLAAAVTRNSYGCLVLNTASLMFVDVDAPEAKESSFLAGLFGFRKPDRNREPDAFEMELKGRVQQWLASRPDWGWRVYRTRAGIRLLATHQPFASNDPNCQQVFDAFNADPLYRKLCATQKCFRARLTPKPWRCDVDKPHVRWPWSDEEWEARFRKWEAEYLATAKLYATCRLVGQFGNQGVADLFRELVEFHDTTTQAKSNLPLA